MKPNIETVSADKFKTGDGKYEFPFEVMDKTPGGSNLGRIEWCVEPIRKKTKNQGRYYIEKILVWAKQTRDPRYRGKLFEIPCFSESITGDALKRESFLNYVWFLGFCTDHGGSQMWAYPANHHSVLKINTYSGISIDIDFQ